LNEIFLKIYIFLCIIFAKRRKQLFALKADNKLKKKKYKKEIEKKAEIVH
jgi:hypothetical protein